MPDRTIEDRLREEYFDLLPDIRRVTWQLETEIRYHTLQILHELRSHEQMIIKSRVKDCESAINLLRRRKEGRMFDPKLPGDYSVLSLADLAGVRVLVFPRYRLVEVDEALRERFPEWTSDPVRDGTGATLAPKYFGNCRDLACDVRGEYQVVPMLIGLFCEVEHSAMYKPTRSLMGIAQSHEMRQLRAGVEGALVRFEEGFERFVEDVGERPGD